MSEILSQKDRVKTASAQDKHNLRRKCSEWTSECVAMVETLYQTSRDLTRETDHATWTEHADIQPYFEGFMLQERVAAKWARLKLAVNEFDDQEPGDIVTCQGPLNDFLSLYPAPATKPEVSLYNSCLTMKELLEDCLAEVEMKGELSEDSRALFDEQVEAFALEYQEKPQTTEGLSRAAIAASRFITLARFSLRDEVRASLV